MSAFVLRLLLALLVSLAPVGKAVHALSHQGESPAQKHGHHGGGAQGCASCAAFAPVGTAIVGPAIVVPIVAATPLEFVAPSVRPLAHTAMPPACRGPPPVFLPA